MKKKNILFKGLVCAALGLLLVTQPLAAAEKDEFAEDDFAAEAKPASSNALAGEAEEGLRFTGFLEVELGAHLGEPGPVTREYLMDNRRFRLATSKSNAMGGFHLKADFIQDQVTQSSYVDLREARVYTTLLPWLDLSSGRQVSTWGVGDMVFINDLFPKNWVNLFLGRDMESMKEASNSHRLTAYLGGLNLDLVVHPEFSPDVTPTGCRFAVYNPNSLLDSSQPSRASDPEACQTGNRNHVQTGQVTHGEVAGRLQTSLGGFELALYGYDGYYKNPKGLSFDGTSLSPYYPRLHVTGLSAEGQLGPGILSLEGGLYDSREDTEGNNPLIENSSTKGLIGYRMDFTSWLGVGVQAYQEQMKDYDQYEEGILGMLMSMGLSREQASQQAPYVYRKEEIHNTYSMRVTVKAQAETLWISLFGYARPQDHDNYVKLDINKRLDNNFSVAIGSNVFGGNPNYYDREFAMMEDQDNAYARLKYNF